MRELIDGQLIQVRVGNADARDLRSDVGDLDRRCSTSARAAPTRSTAARSRSRDRGRPRRRPARGRRPASAESARRCGPFASTNAGVMLSSVRCDTVCRNGKTGVVNGVVMPGHLDPDEAVAGARRPCGRSARPTMPRRGPKLSLCSWRAARGWPSRPRYSSCSASQIEDRRLVVLLGRRKVQRVAQAGIDRDAIGHPPVVLDEVLLDVRRGSGSRPAAGRSRTAAPGRAESWPTACRCSATPGRSVNERC